jgi:hypothetical protein
LELELPQARAVSVASSCVRRDENLRRAAELSRHAAIAGLCVEALGLQDHDRRYYLAKQAWYEGFENDVPHGAPIDLCARLLRGAGGHRPQ